LVLAGFFVNLGEGLSLAKVTRGVANTRDYARGKGIKKERVDFLPPNYEVLHLGNANEKDKQEQPILEFIQKLIADKIAPRLTNVFFKAVTDYLVPTAGNNSICWTVIRKFFAILRITSITNLTRLILESACTLPVPTVQYKQVC